MSELIEKLRDLPGMGDWECSRIDSAQRFFKPALENSGCIQNEMVALEIGCGKGLKAVVFSDLFKRYIGVDLSSSEIAVAKEAARVANSSAEFHVGNGLDFLRNPSLLGMRRIPDLLILYAVLEHMLPPERVEVLKVIRDTIENGGAVFFAETPNRLIPFDIHSSQLHFVQSLPPDLALRYVARSEHASWKHTLDQMGNTVEALYRCGLGLSYHDFELDVREDTTLIPFAFTGWCGELLEHQALQNDEESLHQYLKDNSVRVHPAFSRYWIEGLVSKRAARFHRTTEVGKISPRASLGPVESETRRHFFYPRHFLRSAGSYIAGKDSKLSESAIPRNECNDHPTYEISKAKSLSVFFANPTGLDEYELVILMNHPTVRETVIATIDGRSVQFDCDPNYPKWYQTRSLRTWLTKCPPSISISCLGSASIRAVILNGYSRLAPT